MNKKILLSLGLGLVFLWQSPAQAINHFQVNEEGDIPDIRPGDGVCQTWLDTCSLRAAIQEANNTSGLTYILLEKDTHYSIYRPESGEDEAEAGDLDVHSHIHLYGFGSTVQMDPILADTTGPLALRLRDRLFEVHDGGLLHVVDLKINRGVIDHGGAIRIHEGAIVNLIDVEMNQNFARESAGAVLNAGTLNLTRVKISQNETRGSFGGAGIVNKGRLIMKNSVITENLAEHDDASGGGIHNLGYMLIENSEISRNGAKNMGGGIYTSLSDSSAVTSAVHLKNVTLTQNEAHYGGGLASDMSYGRDTRKVFLKNVTIADNGAYKFGGGIYQTEKTPEYSSVEMVNTILADNEARRGDNCYGLLKSLSHNLVADLDACEINGNERGNIYDADAGLGRMIETAHGCYLPLLADSPAIDAGNESQCQATDQRGVVRNFCDMGAYEY